MGRFLCGGATTGRFVVVDEEWRLTEHRLEVGRIRAVEWDGEYWRLLVDTGEALTLSPTLDVLRLGNKTELPPQASAMWWQGKWRVLRVGKSGNLLLDGIGIEGSAGLGQLLGEADHLWVRGNECHWIVTKLFPPSWTVQVDPDNLRVRTLFESLPFEYSVTDGRPPRWVAMPVMSLGSDGFLQVISDVQSDNRIVFRFSADGSILGQAELTSPVAFVASDQSDRRVWALRSLDRVELVAYTWHGRG